MVQIPSLFDFGWRLYNATQLLGKKHANAKQWFSLPQPDGVTCEIAQLINQSITKKSLRKWIATFKILNKIDKQIGNK